MIDRRPSFSSIATRAVLVMALTLPPLSTSHAQSTQQKRSGPDIYASCNVTDETAFRKELRYITKRALENGLEQIDFTSAVDNQWRQNNLQAVVKGEVKRAIKQVKENSSLTDRVRSIVSKQKAKDLAERVADLAYKSDGFAKAMEDLSSDVARAVSARIELAASDAARPTGKCVSTFLDQRYGSAIAGYVAADIDASFNAEAGVGKVGVGDVILSNKQLIGGTVLLIVRRSIARIARQIGRRVAGAVLSRIASVVAGGVGIALIAYDLFQLRNGVLPIIETEMTSSKTQASIRKELATAISGQLATQLDDIAERSADSLVSVWKEFRAAHDKVVGLAERDPAFRRFLDGVPRTALPRTDRLVALILAEEGDAGVQKRLRDGSLRTAISSLEGSAVKIALETRSIDKATRWASLSGSQLDRVYDMGLHRQTDPSSLDGKTLEALLTVDDPAAVATLTGLEPADRAAVLQLPVLQIKTLARQLSAEELGVFADYTKRLKPTAAQVLSRVLSDDPAAIRNIATPSIRDAVLRSTDQAAAITMMTRKSGPLEIASMTRDVTRAYNGDIAPTLIWHRSPGLVLAVLGGLLLVIWLLKRALFPSRRRA